MNTVSIPTNAQLYFDVVFILGYGMIWYDIYLLTAIGLTPGGSSTVHIYIQTIHRATEWDRIHRTYIKIKIYNLQN